MAYAKVHPEESFFVIPGRKQHEVARARVDGFKNTWSAKHGYDTTFRQEADILKKNKRESIKQEAVIQPVKDVGCCIIV